MTDEKKWMIINKARNVRPLIQQYCGYEEIPPIPVSLPQKGALGDTGDWRTYKPVVLHEKCTKCGQCYIYCPEGVIQPNKEGIYEIDLQYCKGCGICAKICPVKAINMVKEEK
jgi:2-oxoacid:acceptor oxidoreductase delta subunit (pyruvate/2-ketoisovalerate family)